VLVIAVCVLALTLACEMDPFAPSEIAPTSSYPRIAMYGFIRSGAEAKYDVWVNNVELTPTCTDKAAEYRLTVAADAKLPADTHIKGNFPAKQRYFRLDIMAALYELDNGKCNYVNPDDVRTHIIIEGSFNDRDLTLTPLTCGARELGESKMYIYTDNVTNPGQWESAGDVTCSLGDQQKFKFSYSAMYLYSEPTQ
jgi:hypothetical protein